MKFCCCKTCWEEYSDAQKLCERCLVHEDIEHRREHHFFEITMEHDQHIKDDLKTQEDALWRCNHCPFVAGPSLPWSHKHSEISLCFGNASIDFNRPSVLRSCVKSQRYWRALPDPTNAIKSACMTCWRPVAYDEWNLLCLQCNRFLCKVCIDAGRRAHRHLLNLAMVVRKTAEKKPRSPGCTCDGCDKRYYYNDFSGMFCTLCKDYYCCSDICLAGRRLPVEHRYCIDGRLSVWRHIVA